MTQPAWDLGALPWSRGMRAPGSGHMPIATSSRETIEASERVLKELMERRLDAWDLLVIYLDGIQFGSHHVLAAIGVDEDGKKHVLGVREGASENAVVTTALLEGLVERGLDQSRRRLFVIDGSREPRGHHLQLRRGQLPPPPRNSVLTSARGSS